MPDPDTITLDVLLFGQARELAGTARAALDVRAGATVGDAVARLEEVYPALAPFDRVLLTAVNETYAGRSDCLKLTRRPSGRRESVGEARATRGDPA